MVRIAGTEYPCQLGHGEEERNLAALVLARPACNADGKPFTEFPSIAGQLPEPGQTLGVLLRQSLSNGIHGNGESYICYHCHPVKRGGVC
jgi:hypothetical protein